MGIAAKAPRGGLAEELAGASRVFILKNAEVERFEDLHRGIFAIWDGFFGRDVKPTSAEVRDLIALGLVGSGVANAAADKLVSDLGPEYLLRMYEIAQALVGIAFLPAAFEKETDDGSDPEDDAGGAADDEKKPDPAPGG